MAERYYFAARYSRNAELRRYRAELIAAIPEAQVTSRWIDLHKDITGGLEQSFTPEALAADPAGCWQFGQHDLEDLVDATAIVSFTGGVGGKGGRHIEHGIAICYAEIGGQLLWLVPSAARFRLIVVGPRENIFHCHPATEVYATWSDFLAEETRRPGGSDG